ncbi:MAG: hypothetical protein AAGK78_01565, partial [Planctomycetota bacterium]
MITGTSIQFEIEPGNGDSQAAEYLIYRSKEGGSFERIGTQVVETRNIISHGDLPSETQFSYRIYALDGDGDVSTPLVLDLETDEVDDPELVVEITGLGRHRLDNDSVPQIKGDSIIRGVVDDQANNLEEWRLVLRPTSTTNATDRDIVIARGGSEKGQASDASANVDEVLATLQPGMYDNGLYRLVLQAKETNSATVTEASAGEIHVDTEVKFGSFSTSVTDLEVEVPGAGTIVARRVYDSATVDEPSDFGPGWRLELSDSDLRDTSRDGSRGDRNASALRFGDVIYVELPERGRQAFQFLPVPNNYDPNNPGQGLVFGIQTYSPRFVAVDGSRTVLEVDKGLANETRQDTDLHSDTFSLRRDPNTDEFFSVGGVGSNNIETANLGYNPKLEAFGGYYNVRTDDNYLYEVDAATGDILEITDPNLNVTVFANDQASSLGRSIHVERGSDGRIEWISDEPSGNGRRVSFEYDDVSKNLIASIDEYGVRTEYRYDAPASSIVGERPNHLTGVVDTEDVQVLRVAYANDGSVIGVTDAAGENVDLADSGFNGQRLSTRSRDPLGDSVEQIHNSRGDVIREIRPILGLDDEGQTVIKKYIVQVRGYQYFDDAADAVDPLTWGVSVANKLVSSWTYQSFEVAGDDPTGERYTRQPQGLPQQRSINNVFGDMDPTDPDAFRLRFSQTLAPDGQSMRTTEFSEYKLGQAGRTVDPWGRETHNIYDDAGNVVDSREYDADGKLQQRTLYRYSNGDWYTYADGTPRDYRGLPKGLLLETFVQLGSDEVDNDLDGDGTPDIDESGIGFHSFEGLFGDHDDSKDHYVVRSANYYYVDSNDDADGGNDVGTNAHNRHRLLKSVDSLGVATRYTYNNDGRVRETFREWTDADGDHSVRQSYAEFDEFGRDFRQTDVNGQVTTTYYDVKGRQVATRDSFGGLTITTFDGRGNAVRTHYPDGTETRSVFDTAGRLVFTSERFHANSVPTVSFNVNGQESVVAVTWQNDNAQEYLITETVYDSAGRSIGTKRYEQAKIDLLDDPISASSFTSVLSKAGSPISTTSTVYDSAGRV